MNTSNTLFNRAQKFIPGGVNSPVRAFKGVGGDPIFFKSAKGAILTDVDGKEYIDYIGSWGPMICGHSHPEIIEAIREKALYSTSFGAPTEIEIEVAELITSMVPNVDKVRMVNSGTEACMSAIRVARGYTGRNKILKFAGCYHGHADSFLIKAGSGVATFGLPNSPGVTKGVAEDTLTCTYNNLEEVKETFANNKGEIAAIIIEPVAGNMGCIPPVEGFLEGLRTLCDQEGSVLIFDEVMTGFRLSQGGAQQRLGVNADLVTMGKVIGGGMPVGAFGGKAEIMNHVAPVGPVYQAGTLSGNPVAMAAGLAQLSILNRDNTVYETIDSTTEYLHQQMEKVFTEAAIPTTINRKGSMISFHMQSEKIENFDDSSNADIEGFKTIFHSLLRQGIYLPPSAYETWFISTAHTKEHIDTTISALRTAVREL